MDFVELDLPRLKQDLNTAVSDGTLSDVLSTFWGRFVPLVFSGQMSPNIQTEDSKATKVLFNPLEQFLCGGTPDEVFEMLKQAENPREICGRVFKAGEPTYSCRECAVDPTCVLCAECFRNSEHKRHKYRISTSGGGGYCDCGDKEAWKTQPTCDIHQRGAMSEKKSSVETLPSDMRQRASQLFHVILQYTYEVLLWENTNNLPERLRSRLLPAEPLPGLPTHLTMLYNDEIHTYDQVTASLKKAIRCNDQEAMDFATVVDREGRCMVKMGSREECFEVKAVIQRPLTSVTRHHSKPLKVLVLTSAHVAHQTFAHKLLAWLQTMFSRADGLRQLFCDVLLVEDTSLGRSWVEHIMLLDTKLWKAVRQLSHQLVMSAIMLNLESKKEFAIKFTKLYATLASDFVNDDHHHEVSVLSESVQLYTVTTLHYLPLYRAFMNDSHNRTYSVSRLGLQLFGVASLARVLIAEHNLIEVIVNAFLELCNIPLNQGKFKFERSERHSATQRSQFIIHDLKYALVTKPAPGDWTPALHQGYLRGYRSLLVLLSRIQGMDAVVRQVSQHVEFEPEWEPAFSLQLRLSDILMLVTEWCGTDPGVLSEAFVTTVEQLCQLQPPSVPREELVVAGHAAQCIRCNNSVQSVSLHLPVTRMLASLCPHLNLHQQPIRALFDSSRVRLEELMDPAVNVLALVAQYQAGMWRRNGYSLISQVIFYQNFKFRAEMFDKDIVLLQMCASLMDPNEFIIRLLNKFGLDHWAEEDYGKSPFDDIARQTTVLAEELLNLLIYILSERFLPGVGEVDNMAAIRREVVHLLCMQPMTRSEVSKSLPPERYETIVEAVIRDVAIVRKPTESTGKVVFELKPELHAEYNPCFYHYNKSEQSKAEEYQRMRKKKAGEDQALPPPVPPKFVAALEPIVRLLDCDVMVHLLKLVVKRALSKRPKAYSEVQLDRCLHLIGLALHEEKRSFQVGYGASVFSFFKKVTAGQSLLSMLESLASHPNVFHEAQKDLLTWVIKQFSDVRRLSGGVSSPVEAARSSVGLLATEEKARKEKKKKTEQAEKRRTRIMAQMVKMQREFMQENAALFDTVSSELSMSGSEMDVTQGQVEAEPAVFPVCLGSTKAPVGAAGGGGVRHTCILCQEEQEASITDRALVYAAYVQKSAVLSKRRAASPSDMSTYTPLFKSHDSVVGTHTGTCGHAMHADCWQGYFDALFVRDRRRGILHFRGQRSYDVDNLEFLCPLCETISNTVIPIVPPLASLVRDGSDQQQGSVELSLNDWLDALQKTTMQSLPAADDEVSDEPSSSLNPCPLPFDTQSLAESVARNFQLLYDYVNSEGGHGLSESMTEILKKFIKDVYTFGLGVPFDDDNERVPVMTWEACAYTFAVIEHGLRDEGKSVFQSLSLRQTECLRSLVRVGAVCSSVCKDDTVKRHCVTLLSALLCERPAQRTPSVCPMDLDLFTYLVMVSLSLPVLYTDTTTPIRVPTGGLGDLHLLELVYVAHLVQIILVLDDSESNDSEPILFMDADSDDELRQLSTVVTRIRSYAGLPSLKTYSLWQLNSTITGASVPFLRQCALFFHYMTGVAPADSMTTGVSSSEHALLSRYLALPTSISACLIGGWDAASSASISAATTSLVASSPILARLIHSWCSSSSSSRGSMLSASEQRMQCLTVDSLLHVNHLVSLPTDFADLVHRAAAFPCPNSVTGDESRTPAMCLVCGTVVCSQSYCCQSRTDDVALGAAMRHIQSCSISCGLFLRIRDCQLLLLMPSNKGCFYAPPYVDEYGETDQGLRRGNPLSLSSEQYKRLQKLWMSHGVQEEIVHHLESSPTLFGFDWQTM